MGIRKDYTGQVFGFLTAIRPTLKMYNKRVVIWELQCVCGNIVERMISNCSRSKFSSCGCKFGSSIATHHKSKTKVYKTWCGIKDRCFNINNNRVDKYLHKGITMQEDWVDNFIKFYEYIGEPPTDSMGRVWSIERIDNNGNYEEGNIRWELADQQSRNQGMSRNNKSGHKGVYFLKGNNAWVAGWRDTLGKYKTKSFSINKYGDELAFFAACEKRELEIEILIKLGFNYSLEQEVTI